MTDWFQRLFGDASEFALRISLSSDPHPADADPLAVSSWGSVELWVAGRCLTRNVRDDTSQSDGVTWQLLPLLRWLERGAVRLLNEEPFPSLMTTERIGSGAHWLEETERPFVTLRVREENAWFERRDDWWRHHALRRAFPGAAAPNVFLRRLGEHVEVSWDNTSRPATRSDVTFVEAEGATLVSVAAVDAVLRGVLETVPPAIELRSKKVWAHAEPSPERPAWTWLIRQELARAIETSTSFAWLREELDSASANVPEDTFVAPHTPETLLLRSAPPLDESLIASVLDLLRASEPATADSGQSVSGLRRRTPPPARRPWLDGYERALELREQLGWNGEPVGDLPKRLRSLGLVVQTRSLHEQVDGAVVSMPRCAPLVVANPNGGRTKRWHPDMMLATALGHVVMDSSDDAPYAELDTTWSYWPAAARARAFAAMFLMPEHGVQDIVTAEGKVDAETVRKIMTRYGTGAIATTWHLVNLRQITDDDRDALLSELAG